MTKATKPAPYITTTSGLRGFFAVMMHWNNDDGGVSGFWEPYQTGIGSYKTSAEAAVEGRDWAMAEELEFRDEHREPEPWEALI